MDALVAPARARFHPLRIAEVRRETADGVSLVRRTDAPGTGREVS
jgi:hypothetical protein